MPVVFAKKARSINLDGDQYATTIYSFTKQREYPVIVGRSFLSAGGGTAWRASPAWSAWTLSAGRSSSSRRGAG